VRVTTISTEGLHQHGDTGLVFDYQVQHHLVAYSGDSCHPIRCKAAT
jgi:hypothetical protein